MSFTDPRAVELIEELNQEMIRAYGGGDATYVDPSQFGAPDGTFLLLTDAADGASIGCAGLRAYDVKSRRPAFLGDPSYGLGSGFDAELKRMYVRPTRRRQGHAGTLLAAIEGFARSQGYARVILETGTAQPDAVAFYEVNGYRPVEPFGHYADDAQSLCYARVLDQAAST